MNRRFFLSLMPAALAGILARKPQPIHHHPTDAIGFDPDEVARLGRVYAERINRARFGKYAHIGPDVALMDSTPIDGWIRPTKGTRIDIAMRNVSAALEDHHGKAYAHGYGFARGGDRCYISATEGNRIWLLGKGPSWTHAVSQALNGHMDEAEHLRLMYAKLSEHNAAVRNLAVCSHSHVTTYPNFASALAVVTGVPTKPYVRICADCGKNLI